MPEDYDEPNNFQLTLSEAKVETEPKKANKNAQIIIEQMVKAKNKDLKIEWEYKG